MRRDLLIVGCDAPYGRAIAARAMKDGHGVAGVSYRAPCGEGAFPVILVPDLHTADLPARMEAQLPGFRPCAMVVIPRPPRTATVAETSAEDFVAAADEALVGAEVAARYLLCRRAATRPAQIVLLSGWAAVGLPFASTGAAISGGLLGLARSWALELAPDGITVNAVVAGAGVIGSGWDTAIPPIGRMPTEDDVAHAVAFLIDERSAAINGQALFVCGGLTAGVIPA
jgi:NAD(P)-dependent dehydrogenase (short-subunit alcohol dehydrogenase family)